MNEGRKRGRETQPLLAKKKNKRGIKLIYNSKGTINKVVLSREKKTKQQIKKCLATEVKFNRVGKNNQREKRKETSRNYSLDIHIYNL